MKQQTKCLFAARDPGAANVLVPVIRRIQGRKPVCVLALPKAGKVFIDAGIEADVLQLDSIHRLLTDRVNMFQPDVVVTGTSHYEPFDSLLWSLAKQSGLPCCAILDGWFNLSSRFTSGWPGKIFAIDEHQKARLVEFGIPLNAIECIGQLWLAEIASTRRPRLASRHKTRQILFFSEPIQEDVACGANHAYGFDQFEAFKLLKKAVERSATRDNPLRLVVRPHPYENLSSWSRPDLLAGTDNLSVHLSTENFGKDYNIERSDLITGISSVVLLQAIAMGKPVLSVQPNLSRENTLIAAARGFVETILSDNEAAIERIKQLISDDSERSKTLVRNKHFFEALPSGGSDSVVRWIEQGGK